MLRIGFVSRESARLKSVAEAFSRLKPSGQVDFRDIRHPATVVSEWKGLLLDGSSCEHDGHWSRLRDWGLAARSGNIPIWGVRFPTDEKTQRALVKLGVTEILPWPLSSQWLSVRLAEHLPRENALLEDPPTDLDQRRHNFVYSGILDQLQVGLYRVDAEGRVLAVNRVATAILEASCKSEVKSVYLRDLFAEKSEYRKLASKMQTEGAVVDHEVQLRRLNGETVWVRLSCHSAQRRGQLFFEGTLQEIGEERDVRRHIHEVEQTHGSLFRGSPLATLVFSSEGQLLEANETAQKLFGYPRRKLLRLGISSLAPPSQQTEFMRALVGARQGHGSFETQLVSASGNTFVAEVATSVCQVGQQSVVQAIVRDISEEKLAQNALLRQTAVLEATSDMVLMADTEGRVLYLNRAGRRLLQVAEEQDLSASRIRDFQPSEEGQRISGIGLTEASLHGVWSAETQFLDSDGRQITASLVLIAHREESGLVEYFSAIARDITQQKGVEKALRESEIRYRSLFESVPVGLYRATDQGRFMDVNSTMVKMLGFPNRETLLRVPAQKLLVDQRERQAWRGLMSQNGEAIDFECRVRRQDNEIIWVRSSSRLVEGSSGDKLFEGVIQDITERRNAEEALRQKEERFLSLVKHAPDMIAILDADGTLLYESPSFERILGRKPEERVGGSAFDYIHPSDLPVVQSALTELLEEPGKTITLEHRARDTNGEWRVFEATATNLLENPAVGGVVVNSRDISERRQAVQQLVQEALYDSLTGLPNRVLLMDRLHGAFAQINQEASRRAALLFLDLDEFKLINDSLGHSVGDQLLVQIGRTLNGLLRPADLIARLGGDEFVILLTDVLDSDAAVTVAERIHHVLQSPFQVGPHQIFATTSIGIAISRPDTEDPDQLLREADMAMYRAKSSGRGSHALFDPSMHQLAVESLQMQTDIRRGLEKGQFEVYYQPLICLKKKQLVGFESLLRWNHPDRGLLPPADFVDFAEKCGLLVGIGDYAFGQTLEHLARWKDRFDQTQLLVTINLSNNQFFEKDLVLHLSDLIRKHRVDPQSIGLEITEGVLVKDSDSAARRFVQLKQLGVQLLLDDFGTGYSSLSYLHRFPIDILKIDRSFITHLDEVPENREIVQAILKLAGSLGVRVIAEGVEKASQAQELQTMGCHFGQGYLFARPLTAHEATRLLVSNEPGSINKGRVGTQMQLTKTTRFTQTPSNSNRSVN